MLEETFALSAVPSEGFAAALAAKSTLLDWRITLSSAVAGLLPPFAVSFLLAFRSSCSFLFRMSCSDS